MRNAKQRIYLYLILLPVLIFLLLPGMSFANDIDSWQTADEIAKQIIPPVFPENEFVITKYGAVGDGLTNCTQSIAKAIKECQAAGGGRVIIPPGVFLTGAVHLLSNVNLHISKDATLLFSEIFSDYLPLVHTRFEGVECYNYSPFIYAYEQENIAITGEGILDGQAGNNNWWAWKGKREYGWQNDAPNGENDAALLFEMGDKGIPVEERRFGEGHYLRTNFIQPYRCRNILIEGITIIRSPMWVIHPVMCENVTVNNVKVNSHGPNNDGCNPESSKNVQIQNCVFDTGDDCIAIKSGRNTDGRRVNVSSENIIVRDCTMKDGHGGVVIGSETSGSIRNVFVENCIMDSPQLERALRIKTNSLRGGVVENIFMRNCTVGQVSDAVIKVNFNYGEGEKGNFTPVVRNIFIDRITSRKSRFAIYLEGYLHSPIDNMQITNCDFNGVAEQNKFEHVTNLIIKDVSINGKVLTYSK